ncbi:unnamed protein product [Brassica oleracea var. botrytis]|uniref:(rape) hypothetical protein n=1 Tax=Brassica napus TaxID=3708 RepID=A0A816KH42_BRANA|nr:unnamed protein product [Brassica napus]
MEQGFNLTSDKPFSYVKVKLYLYNNTKTLLYQLSIDFSVLSPCCVFVNKCLLCLSITETEPSSLGK